MDADDLKNAHLYSAFNREQLSHSEKCGCFYCLKIFDPVIIDDWCDGGQTAICPYCHVDSVIADSELFPVCKDFLEQMYKFWF